MQFLPAFFLTVNAWNLLDPADPPIVIALDAGSVFGIHSHLRIGMIRLWSRVAMMSNLAVVCFWVLNDERPFIFQVDLFE